MILIKMSVVYRLNFGKGISKLINLRDVSSVYQYNNRITVNYNYTTSNGLLIFGSGFIEQEHHKEIITFNTEEDASHHIKNIEHAMANL